MSKNAKRNGLIVASIAMILLIVVTSTASMVEAARTAYLPQTGGSAYYSYTDHSIRFNAYKLQYQRIYNILIDLDGDHTTAAALYSPGADLGVGYSTPDGFTLQFTWGATASRTEIKGFPCVMRAVKKEMTGETPLGEWFKWTLTKYSPPTNGIVILHASNAEGKTLPIYGPIYYSIDDGCTWIKFSPYR